MVRELSVHREWLDRELHFALLISSNCCRSKTKHTWICRRTQYYGSSAGTNITWRKPWSSFKMSHQRQSNKQQQRSSKVGFHHQLYMQSLLLIIKRLSLSKIVYVVGGDMLPIFNDFFQKDPCLHRKYEQAKADKPQLPDGLTAEMSDVFDRIVKVRRKPWWLISCWIYSHFHCKGSKQGQIEGTETHMSRKDGCIRVWTQWQWIDAIAWYCWHTHCCLAWFEWTITTTHRDQHWAYTLSTCCGVPGYIVSRYKLWKEGVSLSIQWIILYSPIMIILIICDIVVVKLQKLPDSQTWRSAKTNKLLLAARWHS